ncbi:MAG: response regulator [Paracoccus sp. (in: a-proteobacteria)]
MTHQPARRILIVEDEPLLALHLEDMLSELGHTVVGQAGRIPAGLQLAQSGDFDFAILDVNVAGTKSFPIADILHKRGIPFAFATGYGADGLSETYRDFPILQKPYAQYDLERVIAQVCSGLPR